MPEVLAAAHVFCLPSYYGEGIPKALIEAASCGLPLVTADNAGCRDIVFDDQNGLVVPPRDAAALADALERLIGDADLRARYGARGRALVMEGGFSNEKVIEATLDLYEQLATS
jgi:glycosyltransferase involved in cell wall biosynthesis